MTEAAHSTEGHDLIAVARAGEPDRYLAALLAPPPRRDALLALAAFAAEVARIPRIVVHEPAMGEVRLQWWRDALHLPVDARAGHPVADAIRTAALDHALPLATLEALVDARAHELNPEPPPTLEALAARLWATEGALFDLAGRITGPGPLAQEACRAAGATYGLVRLLLDLPRALARGRVPLAQPQLDAAGVTARQLQSNTSPGGAASLKAACLAQVRDHLVTARRQVAQLSRAHRVAFLPLALVVPYLRALEKTGAAWWRQEARIAPLTRVARIGAAHLLGRW